MTENCGNRVTAEVRSCFALALERKGAGFLRRPLLHIRAFMIAATPNRHAAAFTLTVMFTRNICWSQARVIPSAERCLQALAFDPSDANHWIKYSLEASLASTAPTARRRSRRN